ncbi:MAG: GlsB/YeaQ/YmgE family stress response membrane protein [Pseudomonadota bacterium]
MAVGNRRTRSATTASDSIEDAERVAGPAAFENTDVTARVSLEGLGLHANAKTRPRFAARKGRKPVFSRLRAPYTAARKRRVARGAREGAAIMGILTWIVVGLIAGAIAKAILPGNDPGGLVVTIVIGIVGAVIGGFIGRALGFGSVTGFNLHSIVIAVIGSLVLLVGYRFIRRA